MPKPKRKPAFQYLYPMKPKLIYRGAYFERLLDDPGWVAELKYDGNRAMVYVLDYQDVQVWDRHANRVEEDIIPGIYAALRRLPLPPGTILDGELYPRGIAAQKRPVPGKYKLALFDVMGLNEPLRARQAVLRSILTGRESTALHFVEQAHTDKRAFVDRVWEDPNSEGIVLKKLDSKRRDDSRTTKTSPQWLKLVKPTKARA
jgi:ATP-dependent DNA ligase